MSKVLGLLRARRVGRQHWLALLVMVGATIAATWLTPQRSFYEELGRPDYASIIPSGFADWIEIENTRGALIAPAQTDVLATTYSQIVSRIYLHKPSGRHLMLSLAYGDVQQGARQLHRPESCYGSQGFVIQNLALEPVSFRNRSLDTFRMSAARGGRVEQVSYWIRVGDKLVAGPAYELNTARMINGLKGTVVDGLLFRVSEISSDIDASISLHNRFITDLLGSVAVGNHRSLIGRQVSA